MLQIALLLCGRHFIRRNRHFLSLAGLLWGILGALVLTDGMLGARYFPLRLFGWLLLCESLVTLTASSGAEGARRGMFIFTGGTTGAVALLILSGLSGSNLLLAILLGFICFLSGTFISASAWVVRYPHWRRALAGGGVPNPVRRVPVSTLPDASRWNRAAIYRHDDVAQRDKLSFAFATLTSAGTRCDDF